MRAGIHTGEIQQRTDDITGIGVHIAARILGLARDGEILVSRTVTDLVAGSGLVFAYRGDHELRGMGGTWQLFAVDG
jgi:class 3 adenylate cyclase